MNEIRSKHTEYERLELCLQCLEEGPWAINIREGRQDDVYFSYVVREVRLRLAKKTEWCNPFKSHIEALTYLDYQERKKTRELCPVCPYLLEHLVLSQEEVYESRY